VTLVVIVVGVGALVGAMTFVRRVGVNDRRRNESTLEAFYARNAEPAEPTPVPVAAAALPAGKRPAALAAAPARAALPAGPSVRSGAGRPGVGDRVRVAGGRFGQVVRTQQLEGATRLFIQLDDGGGSGHLDVPDGEPVAIRVTPPPAATPLDPSRGAYPLGPVAIIHDPLNGGDRFSIAAAPGDPDGPRYAWAPEGGELLGRRIGGPFASEAEAEGWIVKTFPYTAFAKTSTGAFDDAPSTPAPASSSPRIPAASSQQRQPAAAAPSRSAARGPGAMSLGGFTVPLDRGRQ
jgi:hypothetical protein